MSTAQQQQEAPLQVNIKLASEADIPALVDLFATFFSESHYRPHLTFDPERATAYLQMAIGTGHSPHICAEVDGKLVGVICYHIDTSFSVEPLAVLDEVYVLEPYRLTRIGRTLVAHALTLAKGDGAVCMHIPLSSGHKAMPTLVNLWKKFGAEEIGTIMRKVL
jgi:GNAT superfamily N-acetyltransferase